MKKKTQRFIKNNSINDYKKHHPKAIKSLGQNFLIDQSISDKIIYSIGNINSNTVIEIGPGTGALTRSILNLTKCKQLIAIEKDKRMIIELNKKNFFAKVDGSLILENQNIENYTDDKIYNKENRLILIEGDALQINYKDLIAKANVNKVHIIGNVPYNIGTELIFLWLDSLDLFISITVMLQLEVAKRITAKPGNGDYGWLSIISSILCENEIIVHVPPESFSPIPKVQSAVVNMIPRTDILNYNFIKLRFLCKKAFLQRRKKISNSLKGIISQEHLEQVGISHNSRPEDITVEQYCTLSIII